MSRRGLCSCLILAAGVLGAGSGCGASYLPNTDVEDTADNKVVVEFCEAYRKAVERQDIATLLEMASPDYYENGGNVDASDDIDFTGLRDYFSRKFADVTAIRYEIRYRRISRDEECTVDGECLPYIFVDFTYSGSFRLKTKAGEKWRSTVEENRLELVADGESYKIIAGM